MLCANVNRTTPHLFLITLVTRTSVPAIAFLLTKRAFPHEEKPLTLFRLVKSEGRVLVKLLTAANH